MFLLFTETLSPIRSWSHTAEQSIIQTSHAITVIEVERGNLALRLLFPYKKNTSPNLHHSDRTRLGRDYLCSYISRAQRTTRDGRREALTQQQPEPRQEHDWKGLFWHHAELRAIISTQTGSLVSLLFFGGIAPLALLQVQTTAQLPGQLRTETLFKGHSCSYSHRPPALLSGIGEQHSQQPHDISLNA